MKNLTLWVTLFLSVYGSMAHAALSKTVALSISSKGDEMVFDKATLIVRHEEQVKLTFKNSAKPNSGLQHNWVLVKIGDVEAVANAGIAAGAAKGWTPDSPSILAKTKLLNPGESETISFKAPEKPGLYPYLCTFPGHAFMMKGVLDVK